MITAASLGQPQKLLMWPLSHSSLRALRHTSVATTFCVGGHSHSSMQMYPFTLVLSQSSDSHAPPLLVRTMQWCDSAALALFQPAVAMWVKNCRLAWLFGPRSPWNVSAASM